MTNSDKPSAEYSRVPVLVAPRAQSLVDGSRVTFTWQPVESAKTYTLQIASEPTFQDVVHEEVAGSHTSIDVVDAVSNDEATYFWRVLSRDQDGSIHGTDNIESFISGEPSDARRIMRSPDQTEDLGPVGELARAARAQAGREVTQDPKYISEEIKLGVAHEGIEAGQIIGFFMATAVALILGILALIQFFDITADTVRYEMAGLSGYPELRESQFEAVRRLSEYGAVEGAPDRFRIPINRAMELMANEAYQDAGDAAYSDELELIPRD